MVNRYKEPFTVYIGRGSLWGNPYTVAEHGRDKCIELYEAYIRKRLASEPGLLAQLIKLRGEIMGCYCKPNRCHGDILIKIIEEYNAE